MWYYVGLVLLFLFYLSLAKKKLDWAIMLILIGLPAYLLRFEIFGIPFTVLEGMILVSFFVWLISKTNFKEFLKGKYGLKDYLKNKKKRSNYPFGAEAVLVIIAASLAVAVAGFSSSALGIWKAYFFEPLLFFILILNNFQDKKGFRKIVFSLSVGAFIVSLYAIFQKITGFGIANDFWAQAETRRVVSFFGYPNAVGLYLAPVIMIIFSYLYKNLIPKRNNENIFFILTIVLSLSAIYFAKSEGALIAVVGALFIFGLFADKTSRLMVGGFLFLIASILVFHQPIREYALKKATLMDLSGQIRRQQWTETWQMFQNGRFVSGSGLSGYQEAILPYHSEGIFYNDGSDSDFHRHTVFNAEYRARVWQPVEIYLYPHNLILNFWTELGLLGVLVFIWLFLRLIYSGLKIFLNSKGDLRCRFLSLGLVCAILTMVIHGIVDVPYFKNDLALLFWLLAAMLGIMQLKAEQIKNRNRIAVGKGR